MSAEIENPLKQARRFAKQKRDETGDTWVIWKDWNGLFYVTRDGHAQPWPSARRFEVYRSRQKKSRIEKTPRFPGMGVCAREITKPKT